MITRRQAALAHFITPHLQWHYERYVDALFKTGDIERLRFFTPTLTPIAAGVRAAYPRQR